MRFAAAVSVSDEARAVGRELVDGARAGLTEAADLAVLFVTGHLIEEVEAIATAVREGLGGPALIGCTCESIIGVDQEVERVPGASLLAGRLPGVAVRPFHVGMSEWQSLLANEERLQQRIGTGEEHRAQIVLGDPFTTPIDELLQALDGAFPRLPTVGGMASAASRPGGNRLLLNDQVLTEGVVGVGLGGPIRVDTVVSQGCRPVGRPMVVTRSQENWILELGRRRALDVAEEMLSEMSEADRELLQNGILLGIAIDEYKESFGRGDFLVRSLISADRESGGLAVSDIVRPGQSVQLHVRDAATADEDLRLLLQAQNDAAAPPAGGLLFSCNGRGRRMFDEPHHDVSTILQALPGAPIAGFFAAGELGPIGGRSFIHGFTASMGFFRPLRDSV